ncbi:MULTISPECIES: carboxyl-terminal processing protease CtpC [Planktothricoides]|uniref:Carboxyl-terminal-processing protease n=2 Tax=Planktothricoides raciborskii TaxID=132608 RepID=A0AAU8J9D8_9CYAN|nr:MULTISPECIES: carboxyl-terminal processing protease CtpC [Planktothricoides]KOR36759.1 peptidase S41 [Planktothricoides sp. SR001]MBD2547485.1 PDZ domain-containing protein [Planktothricoides raciborskii FACHB-1370]MBD2585986.1 PDZ domain-containing protein [Planktothricoides raciborskii FACHB-1261]
MVIKKRGLVLGTTAFMLTAITVTVTGLLSQGQAFFQDSPKELVDEVWQIVDREYVDGTFNSVDWRTVRQDYVENRSYQSMDQAYDAIREMLEQIQDPYTRFMDPEEFRNMQIDTSGELTGVGIQLAQDEETKQLVVIAPIEDTPAFRVGIQAKDVILKINGQSTEGMDVNQAVSLIRGPVGTEVTLTIKRDKEPEKDYTMRRDRIEIHPVRYSLRDSDSGKIGYIRLNQFNANAAEEMRQAIQDLENQKVTGYILDLRSNPGGLLYSSVEIARMWLSSGTIVSTVNRRGEMDRQEASGRSLTEKPLVVLVDGGSASASEILSGALQDNGRAVVVGTKTFGKGLVQSVRGLGDGSGLAVTIAKYLTPNGTDINHEGIHPDIEIDLTEEAKEAIKKDRTLIGTETDTQYAEALKVLKEEIAASRRIQAGN